MNNHVPSLKTCQKLKAAGFPQETQFGWFKVDGREQVRPCSDFEVGKEKPGWSQVSFLCFAPLLTEILEQLPARYDRGDGNSLYLDMDVRYGKKYLFSYKHVESMVSLISSRGVHQDNPAEAAALLWLKLNAVP